MGSVTKFLRDDKGNVLVRIKEDEAGRVIEVVTYNDCQQQKWKIVETRTDYSVWEKI